MEQPVEQPCYCDVRLCGKNALYKYFNNENISCQNLVIYEKHQNVNQIKVYITALKRFRIFSKLFDSQRVGTPSINE